MTGAKQEQEKQIKSRGVSSSSAACEGFLRLDVADKTVADFSLQFKIFAKAKADLNKH